MLAKVLGITSYEKDGKKNYTLHYCQEFTAYDKERGAEGLKVATVWTNLSCAAQIFPDDLVELQFEPGYQDRATLVDIVRYPKSKEHPLNLLSVRAVFDSQTVNTETAASAKGGK